MTEEGKNLLLTKLLADETWELGLISSVDFQGVRFEDTLDDHPGWVEVGPRQVWDPDIIEHATASNSVPVVFQGPGQIKGLFITNGTILLAIELYEQSKSLTSDSTLSVTYELQ